MLTFHVIPGLQLLFYTCCLLANVQTIHGAERGEASALLLSHEKPLFLSDTNVTSGGSQFTYFLTAPLQAFYQLIGLSSDIEPVSCLDAFFTELVLVLHDVN